MPKQSRGFWVCLYCERFFDRYQDAIHHEQFLCSRRRRSLIGTIVEQQGMAPYSSDTAATPSAPPQMQVQRMQSQLPPPLPPQRPPQIGTEDPRHHHFELKPPPTQRYLPVLGSQDPNPFRHTVDTMVCRAMEFFEVDVPQVGLRCVACVQTPHSFQSYIFPQNTRSIGLSLRQAAVAHLKQCRNYPAEYQQILNSEQPPSDLNDLTEFCMTRCHIVGILDRPTGGLIFANSRLPPPPPPPPLPQQYYQSARPGEPPAEQFFVPEVPADYPFVFVDNSRWICKFCANLHPDYREPQSCWANMAPPPARFVDYHLSVCREFQRGYNARPPQFQQQQQQPQQRGFPMWDGPGMAQPTPQQPHELPAKLPPSLSPSFPAPPAVSYDASPRVSQQQPQQPGDVEAQQAIDYLEANDRSRIDHNGNPVPEPDILVLPEDRLLLTEYFFFLMKQLRPVRFSEADRRTRGGKREKVKIGYGGLQCVHCVDIPQARKFFWSNVDRLANSFAEIPAHIFRCKRCPEHTKNALTLLKQRHSEQMSRLPRGSQKVFFRRMWRRLHEPDAPAAAAPVPETAAAASTIVLPDAKASPASSSGSDESQYFLRRPAIEAAKALLDGSIQEGPPTPRSRVLLAIPEDRHWVSDTDCFIRRQLEVFCASTDDVATAEEDHKYPVQVGQVGIRCLHCALSHNGAKGPAVAFPFTISGIYEAAKEFQRVHLDNCVHLPMSAKAKFESLKGSSSLSSMLRKHYVLAAKAIGLRDTDEGIRAGATPIPVASALSFSEGSSPEEGKRSKKRKADESREPDRDESDEPRKKRAV